MPNASLKSFCDQLRVDQIEYVDFRFTDPRGVWHHMTFHTDAITPDVLNEGIMFGGTFKKRRCIFKKISAYILDSNDIYYPVNFKSFQNRGNRPAFKNKQSYGPWVVFNFASHINPKYFEVYVEHENCPSTPINQTNLFLRSKWEDQD